MALEFAGVSVYHGTLLMQVDYYLLNADECIKDTLALGLNLSLNLGRIIIQPTIR